MASDAVIAARVELMQEFKDRKSSQWDPNYMSQLAQGQDDDTTKEKSTIVVNRNQATQGQTEGAPHSSSAIVVTVATK